MTLRLKIFILLTSAIAINMAGERFSASKSSNRLCVNTLSTAKPKQQKKSNAKAKKPQTSADAKKQKQQTQKQIQQTQKQLKEAEGKLKQNLQQVTRLESDIARSTENSARLKARIDSITAEAKLVKDSITAGEAELERLRGLYIRAVRSSRKNRREMNATTFLFSAETFRQAWRRMHYLEEFSGWRKRKTTEINDIIKNLEAQRAALEELKVKVTNLRRESLAEERRLRTSKASLAAAVDNLKGKQKELNSMLQRQQKTLSDLDREIERLIQKEIEEQRRREEKEKAKGKTPPPAQSSSPTPKPTPSSPTAQTGNFAAQKGKLPSPLSHTYVVVQGFGVQKHHSIKTIEFSNPGVDLETASGATARAVYPGEVSAVFRHEGLGYVVLVRHGEYLTVYSNLKNISVAKGTKLKTGDVIGTVAASDSTPSRGQLHFEIRRERDKLDPMQWLKR